MRRVYLVFISMVVLATLSLGLLWRQIQSLNAVQATFGNVSLAFLFSLILVMALLGLARILYRAALSGPADDWTSRGR